MSLGSLGSKMNRTAVSTCNTGRAFTLCTLIIYTVLYSKIIIIREREREKRERKKVQGEENRVMLKNRTL